MKVKLLSRVQLLATPWTGAHQAPPPMGFSRQQYWSGVPSPSPATCSSFQFLASQRGHPLPCSLWSGRWVHVETEGEFAGNTFISTLVSKDNLSPELKKKKSHSQKMYMATYIGWKTQQRPQSRSGVAFKFTTSRTIFTKDLDNWFKL